MMKGGKEGISWPTRGSAQGRAPPTLSCLLVRHRYVPHTCSRRHDYVTTTPAAKSN
jgi:hypothetical protein